LTSEFTRAIDYCEAVIDGTHDSPKQVEDGRKLVTSKNIIGGKLDLENCYNISEEDFEQINKRSKVYEWDILMSMIGTVGEICLLKDEPDYAIKNVGVFRAKNESDAKWLYYYLTSPSAQYDIYARLRGSTQKFLPLGELRSFPILKPENEEIKSKIINQLFSIDYLISLNERLNEKVSELISALFRSWFIDFDPVRAKTEGRLPYGMDAETAAMFPDSFEDSELGPIPIGWRVGMMEDVLSRKQDSTTPGEHLSPRYYVPIDNIDSKSLTLKNWLPYHDAASSLILFSKNDLLFGAMRPYFHKVTIALFDGITRSTCFVFAPKVPRTLGFSLCLLNLDSTIRYSTDSSLGSTMPYAIWKNGLARHKIVLPSPEIMIAFSDAIAPLIEKIRDGGLMIRNLSSTRDVLLPRLMSEELKVN
jgi:type I restriction enzyme, S subunit